MMLYQFSNKYYYCFAFIVVSFNKGLCQYVPAIPCPQYFNYQYEGNEIIGFININGPQIGQLFVLNVVFSVGTPLTTKHPGSLELYGTQEQALQRILHNKPLQYKVKFPPGVAIPTLTEISYNNNIICSGSPVQADVVTTIKLHHNLSTKLFLTNRNDENPSQLPNTVFGNIDTQPVIIQTPSIFQTPSIIQAPSIRPTESTFIPIQETPVRQSESSSHVTNNPVNQESVQCGVPSMRFQSVPLIVNGEDIERGAWPWLATVYKTEMGSTTLVCAGNLISPKAVITAAHCFVKYSGYKNPVKNYIIQLGRYNLTQFEENGYVSKKCSAIHVHEDYKAGSTYDADIAIAVMENSVTYTEYIRPICLWRGDINQRSIVGRKGVVVGWGITEENKISPVPRRVDQPIVDETKCLRSDDQFFHITSNRTLCAGDQNGRGPCSGDSGSGLAINEQGRWMLRATVTVSLAKSGNCDLNNYVVYCDIAQFLPWIQKYLL